MCPKRFVYYKKEKKELFMPAAAVPSDWQVGWEQLEEVLASLGRKVRTPFTLDMRILMLMMRTRIPI